MMVLRLRFSRSPGSGFLNQTICHQF
jgi:hypothetical protein